jgi:hypothetical protein
MTEKGKLFIVTIYVLLMVGTCCLACMQWYYYSIQTGDLITAIFSSVVFLYSAVGMIIVQNKFL